MKNKKESLWTWDKKFGIVWMLFVIFFITMFVAILLIPDEPFNTDIHICEETCKDFMGYGVEGIKTLKTPTDKEMDKIFKCLKEEESYCFKKRDKTPTELLEQHCIDNPDDSEKCKCEEEEFNGGYQLDYDLDENCYRQQFECDIQCYEETGSVLGKCHTDCALNTTCVIKKFYDCTLATPIPQPIEIDLETERCVEHTDDSFLLDLDNENARGRIQCGLLNEAESRNYDRYCCTKKEPLTECEKGNVDFIEEEICVERAKDSVVVDNEGNINRWYINQEAANLCTKNQTTCRQKTNVEKLDSYSCENLRVILYDNIEAFNPLNDCNYIINSFCHQSHKDYETILQAFRQKECTI